jgi:sugar phosphate isomerase/epimerase
VAFDRPGGFPLLSALAVELDFVLVSRPAASDYNACMAILATSVRGSRIGDAPAEAHQALDAGFQGLGLLRPLFGPDWEVLEKSLPRESILTLELFLPYPRGLRPGEPCPFRLGSAAAEDIRDAVKYGTETLRIAARHGIPSVLVSPTSRDDELRRRRKASIEDNQVSGLRKDLEAARQLWSASALDALKRVLSRLLDTADRQGVRLALVPGGWIDELPNEPEVLLCLEEFCGAPLDVWLDTFRCTVSRQLGVHPVCRHDIPDGLRAGVSLRDYDGDWNARLPGGGVAPWKEWLAGLSRVPVWLVDRPCGTPPEALSECREFLETLSVPETGGNFPFL